MSGNHFSWADLNDNDSEDDICCSFENNALDFSNVKNSNNSQKIIENSEELQQEYIRKEIDYNKTKISSKNINVQEFEKTKSTNNEWNVVINKKNNIKKEKGKCFTCYPERKVKKHIILPHINEDITFHHDMWNRNMIIATPNKHYHTMKDFPDNELIKFFRTIDQFCINWNLEDYSITFNHGEWQNHHHFHVKIKILDKIANRMRGDHFRLIKRNEMYINDSESKSKAI